MTSELNGEPIPELTATLPRSSTLEFLSMCKKAGMAEVRIHLGKMNAVEASELIREARELGLKSVLDTSGKTPRVTRSPGMVQIADGPEKGNWYYPIKPRDSLLMVPYGANDQRIEELKIQFGLDDTIKVVSISYVPPVEEGDNLHFADGKIDCDVRKVHAEKGNWPFLVLEVKSVRDTDGLYWNMKADSRTKSIHSGSEPVLTQADIGLLRHITEQPDAIAISFVSEPMQVIEARKILEEMGFDGRIVSKIETIEGVKNAAEIAEQSDVVVVARGDLSGAAKQSAKNLRALEWEIVNRAQGVINHKGKRVSIVIATNVADSLLGKARKGLPISRLEKGEQVALLHEFPVSDGFWLAAETMITGDKAPEIIRRVSYSIKVTRRWWRQYGTGR
jgi:hypothetical protein